jgi:predicted transcriptional regulator
VKKTSVYLDPELDRALTRLARAEGRSKAELVREAVAARVSGSERPRIGAIAVGTGPGDVADDLDGYLSRTGFGAR